MSNDILSDESESQEPAAANQVTTEEPATQLPKEETVKQEVRFNKQNINVQHPTTKPIPQGYRFPESIDLPSGPFTHVQYTFSKIPNINLTNSKEAALWGKSIENSIPKFYQNQQFEPTLENPDANFVQEVEGPKGKLYPSAPRLPASNNAIVQGERGVIQFLDYLGLGTVFRTPLWNTGIWITLKAPSDTRLLELQRQIANEKYILGRTTYGLALSNRAVYVTNTLLDFALEHLYQTNLATEKNLKEIISVQDITTVIWALANVIWNNGFRFRTACTHNPDVCQHVVEELLNVSKLLWVNDKAFTPYQLAHMAKTKTKEVTEEDVKRYKDENILNRNHSFKVTTNNKEIEFILRIPNASDHIEAGQRWVSDIVTMVNSALGTDNNLEERNQLILSHSNATDMRQHIHWIEKIIFDSNEISDRQTLESVLDRLSAEDSIRHAVNKEIKKFTESTTSTVIGILSYTCPNCKGHVKFKDSDENFASVIPIDVYDVFFNLLVQKATNITNRDPMDGLSET